MNKKQWRRLHRAYRVLGKDIYQDECPYELRDKYEALPECVKVYKARWSGYELLYLWERCKYAISRGADPVKAKRTFRRCISSNTSLGPNCTVGQGYPCYWDGR